MAHGDPALKEPLEFLLSCVASFEGRGRGLADGVTIQFGWSLFKLRADGGDLVVQAPDFARDPFHAFVDDCSVPLRVASSQAEVCRLAKVEPADVTFQQTLILRKGCLRDRGLYVERQRPTKKTLDSGWYVGPLESEAPPGADDLEAFDTFRLLDTRPVVLSILQLPVGYLATIDGERLVDIANEKNKTIWVS